MGRRQFTVTLTIGPNHKGNFVHTNDQLYEETIACHLIYELCNTEIGNRLIVDCFRNNLVLGLDVMSEGRCGDKMYSLNT